MLNEQLHDILIWQQGALLHSAEEKRAARRISGFKEMSRGCSQLTSSAVLLFFIQLFTSTFQVFTREIVNAVQIAATVLVAFIVLSVVWKGVVPLIICILGIVLMYYSVIQRFVHFNRK